MTADGADSVPIREAPAAPADAEELFGARLGLASRYADLLAGIGVEHGHIGPREVARLWSRHLMNSAVLTELLPVGATFVDVGSGAGLPALPMVIRRPDLSAVLVEPMLRRTRFLDAAVAECGLDDQVTVVRGRADEAAVRTTVGTADWVVARAVAPLDRLVTWCLPLLVPGGRLLALKGSSAEAEVEQHRAAVARAGGRSLEVITLSTSSPSEPADADDRTWVVSIERGSTPRRNAKGRR